METHLSTLLNQLSKELERIKSPLIDFFQPGIARRDIDEKLKKEGVALQMPAEVFDLYKWRNGLKEEILDSKAIGEISLFSLGIFSSLAAAIKSYQHYAIQNKYWDEGMFPLWESGGGDFYLIDCNKKSKTYRRIMFFSHIDPIVSDGVKSKFDSIETLIQSILECYQRGIYRYDYPDRSFLEVDDKLQLIVFIGNNQKSEYWKIALEM